MKSTVNMSQYRALNALRGVPDGVHMMIMCSRRTEDGAEIEGAESDFRALVEFVGEEVAEGLVVGGAARALVALCEEIEPGCSEWMFG